MAKLLMFTFKDTMTHSYSAPQVVRGIDDYSKADLKEAYDRITASGKVPMDQDGLELHILGEFDDNTAKFVIYDEPEYLTTLHAKKE